MWAHKEMIYNTKENILNGLAKNDSRKELISFACCFFAKAQRTLRNVRSMFGRCIIITSCMILRAVVGKSDPCIDRYVIIRGRRF